MSRTKAASDEPNSLSSVTAAAARVVVIPPSDVGERDFHTNVCFDEACDQPQPPAELTNVLRAGGRPVWLPLHLVDHAQRLEHLPSLSRQERVSRR